MPLIYMTQYHGITSIWQYIHIRLLHLTEQLPHIILFTYKMVLVLSDMTLMCLGCEILVQERMPISIDPFWLASDS